MRPALAIAGCPMFLASNLLLRARHRRRQRRHLGPDDVAEQVWFALVAHQVRVPGPVKVGE